MDNRDYYLALSCIPGVGNISIEKLEENFRNDLELFFDASDREILDIKNLNLNIKKNIVKYRSRMYLDNLKEMLYKKSVNFICCKDEQYPKKLNNIYNNPKVLFYKGNLNLVNEGFKIGMVGSRKPTAYGIYCAKNLSEQLSNYGINIVSGLAIGIDSYCHIGCMSGLSKTIAVLGSGLDNILPKKNIKLAHKILENDGLIISEYNVNTTVIPSNFCMRNRIISGVSDGVVVVEAATKSGALITVEYALEQGKDVFSVPGNINSEMSKGCNKIIQDGAKLINSIEDILEEYNIINCIKFKNKQNKDISTLCNDEKIILNLIKKEGVLHIDEICEYTDINVKSVNTVINKLLLYDIIFEIKNKTYSINFQF